MRRKLQNTEIVVVGSAREESCSVKDIERRNASNEMAQDSGESRRRPEQAEGNMPQRAEARMRTTHDIRGSKGTQPGLNLLCS